MNSKMTSDWRQRSKLADAAKVCMACVANALIFAALLLPCATLAAKAPAEILLWPFGAPGSEGKTGKEQVRIYQPTGDHVITDVNEPSITPYLPPRAKARGTAVIVVPGGGHRELWVDNEGVNIAQWLTDHGITAFVLKYRLAKATNSTYTVDRDELADAQRAIRLVRSRAHEWAIDPARVGVMGFSAGGEVAFLTAMHFDAGAPSATDPLDRVNCRPDFEALIYPGNSKRLEPSTNSPPAFLACGAKDRADISEGLPAVYLKFKQAGVPVELHIYAGVGHGFGLRPTNTGATADWLYEFDDWLVQMGLLKPPLSSAKRYRQP